MRLELILSMGFVSIIYGNTHFPMDSQFFLSQQPNLHIGLLPDNNYQPQSTLNPMQKQDRNCFANINNRNDKMFFLTYGNKYESTARRRRTIQGWKLTEPLYVEEPKWVLIDDPHYLQGGRRSYVTNKEDPFYITRGKRMPMEYLQDYERGRRSSQQLMPEANDSPDANIHSENSLSNNSPMYYQMNSADTASAIQNDEIHLRDKHSDIIDMLQEPFVISRGKKNTNKHDGHDEFLHSHEFNDDMSLRARRGKLFDQLMKDKDPFYVARGKRHPAVIHGQL